MSLIFLSLCLSRRQSLVANGINIVTNTGIIRGDKSSQTFNAPHSIDCTSINMPQASSTRGQRARCLAYYVSFQIIVDKCSNHDLIVDNYIVWS